MATTALIISIISLVISVIFGISHYILSIKQREISDLILKEKKRNMPILVMRNNKPETPTTEAGVAMPTLCLRLILLNPEERIIKITAPFQLSYNKQVYDLEYPILYNEDNLVIQGDEVNLYFKIVNTFRWDHSGLHKPFSEIYNDGETTKIFTVTMRCNDQIEDLELKCDVKLIIPELYLS